MRLPSPLAQLPDPDALALLYEWLQLVPGPVVFLDTRTNKVAFANHAAERLFCNPGEHLTGKTRAWCIRRKLLDESTSDDMACAVNMTTVHFAQNRLEQHITLKKKELTVRTDYHPVVIDDDLRGVLATYEDLTEERMARNLRDDLMQMMFHDMKHPLSAIGLNLDGLIVVADEPLNDQQMAFIATAKSKVEQLQRMFGTMVDIGKLEQGVLAIHPETLDINELVGEVLRNTFALQFDAAGKRLTFSPSSHLFPISADPALITRVLENLLDNALKFTKAGGVVDVRTALGADRHSVRVIVRDQGPGVPAKHRKVIFEKYRQVHLRRAGTKAGVGLGLAFCRLAIEAHGGEIWMDPASKGGSDFGFQLPETPIAVD